MSSCEEVLLFSMDFSVPKPFGISAHFCLKKIAFLTDRVYWLLNSLKSCISRGLFDANAVRHRMFLCWSRAVMSGVNKGLYLFLVQRFFEAHLKSNQASSTDGMRSISFQDACSQKCLTVMRGGHDRG